MLGIGAGIRKTKEKEEAIHLPGQKYPVDGRIAEEKEHYFFQNRKTP
ncbi:MAG: hypothetical protein XE08_0111 [Parcubacteria bacterium 32_520]|nr:MAG: hypothetical protein XE08_0111 [Parcubacteria bacterium 32_520]